MKKLLVGGAVVTFALLGLLLHLVRAPADAAPASRSPSPPPVADPPMPIARPVAKLAVVAPADVDGKVNANSDDFFDRFVERQPKVASRAAMTCYRGTHHPTMDAWIRFSFVGHIKNGEVTFSDVKTKESRLGDKTLEDCMLAAVANTHWHDDTLPDVDSYEDETTLNPERGGKKYLHDSRTDNATPAPADTPR